MSERTEVKAVIKLENTELLNNIKVTLRDLKIFVSS